LPDLSPFPTRRSSDLSAIHHSYRHLCFIEGCAANASTSSPGQPSPHLRWTVISKVFTGRFPFQAAPPYSGSKWGDGWPGLEVDRSEEHTSELQSRVDL